MASLPPSVDQTAESLQNLSMDAQVKRQDVTETSTIPYGSLNNGAANVQMTDPGVGYSYHPSQSIYYADYNDKNNQWSDVSRTMNHGVEMQGGYQYGHNSYSPYPSSSSPIPTFAHHYGTQQYQYSSPFYQQPPTPIPNANANANRNNTLTTTHTSYKSPFPRYDGYGNQQRLLSASQNSFTSARNQNNYSGHYMGYHAPRPTQSMYPNSQLYNHYGNTHTNFSFGSSRLNSRTSMSRGNENFYGFNELNRGPRAAPSKNPNEKQEAVTVGKEDSNTAVIPDKEMYNRDDFPEEYPEAKFFIIKSYSEDDIHKSIKYSVWSSTNNGNKKLDAAYNESREKAGGCPVFLFFSVNASGQFVGVAEMVGPVDFEKTVDYWHQDKWTGCFSVKWHIIKDVPNRILRHITLENNENKPVTNSRDTQEVKLEQGIQMIKIFKNHESKTSILDDFVFYEKREKGLIEKKANNVQVSKQVLDEKKVGCEGKDKEEGTNAKTLESASSGNNESSAE